jgi:hypothetical protein
MGLIDRLEEIFLEEFNGLDIDNVDKYMKENSDTILFLRKFKRDVDKKIEEALGDKIIKKVKENYYPKLFRGCSTNALAHPEYFAYALEKNIFSFNELYKINLGKDSWKNAFIIKYSKENLLKNFREELLHLFE